MRVVCLCCLKPSHDVHYAIVQNGSPPLQHQLDVVAEAVELRVPPIIGSIMIMIIAIIIIIIIIIRSSSSSSSSSSSRCYWYYHIGTSRASRAAPGGRRDP